jgi:dipeptidyl aminopeptidase/acylaminoacyl peptidase
VIAAAVGVVIAGLVSSAQASFPGSDGDIYFTGYDRNVGIPRHVYAVRPDGTGLRRLTSGDADDEALAVAPGGGSLVVSRDTGEQCGHTYWAQGVDLFTVALDGSTLRRLTDNCPMSDSTPAWSPSGGHIVFSRVGELWSMRADGTGLAKLTCNLATSTRGDGGDYAPVWSPDGRLIAFSRYGDVYVMDANGDNARFVATGGSPAFSPNGTRLAYAGPDFGDQQGIHTISITGTDDARLTTERDADPVWSPDGKRIAFIDIASITAPQRFVLETMNADGSDRSTIVDAVNAATIDWANGADGTPASEPDVTAADTACTETAPPPQSSPGGSPAPTTILASALQPPDRLVVSSVVFNPRVLRARKAFDLQLVVRDLRGLFVANAVVQATALRGDARSSSLRLTGADGRATLRMTPTRRLRLAAGSRLVLLVRVRRPANGWASPASGTRLTSVRTR